MNGVTLKRRIDYPGAYEFTLTDEIECNDKKPRDVNFLFHIPRDKHIVTEENIIRIESPKNICTIRIETADPFTVYISKGKTSTGEIRSQVSWRVKQCEDSFIVIINFKNFSILKVKFYVSISKKATQPVKVLPTQKTGATLASQQVTQLALSEGKSTSTVSCDPAMYARELVCGTRHITWYLKKAKITNAPFIVILHGQGYSAQPAKFSNPNWNVICPMDYFGWEKAGSWYLGENGDFFWLDAIGSILEQARSECGTGKLYFWGSSMGGYGALLHGYLHNAAAVYASVPQIHFYGTAYGLSNQKYFDPIFGGKESIYNNLINVMTMRHRTLYFMAYSGLESGCNYIKEQCIPLINHFIKIRQRYYLEIYPSKKHTNHHTIASSLDVLNRVIRIDE